jgi:hypothetical protein
MIVSEINKKIYIQKIYKKKYAVKIPNFKMTVENSTTGEWKEPLHAKINYQDDK